MADKITKPQKAKIVTDFVTNTNAEIDRLSENLNENIRLLDKIKKQKSADIFAIKETAGADFVEKYDLIPGTELYDNVARLRGIKLQNMQVQDKQAVMLILCAGIFYGAFEYIAGDMKDAKNVKPVQKVALHLMSQDVAFVRKKIGQTLANINKYGVRTQLRENYMRAFYVYDISGKGKKDYNTMTKCAQWCENPKEHQQEIVAYKDYIMASLGHKYYPALFNKLFDVARGALCSMSVDAYFKSAASVHTIEMLLRDLWSYRGQGKYILAPAIQPWLQCMQEGLSRCAIEISESINNTNAEITKKQAGIAKLYDCLPKEYITERQIMYKGKVI